MTLEGIAKGLERQIELNQHAFNSIKKAYDSATRRGILKLEGMTKERKKMAYLPRGSTPLPNSVGTAPGVKLSEKKTTIFILPGVPAEMKSMFRNVVTPLLKETKGKFIEKGFIFTGIGESQIAPYITKLEQEYSKLWIKTHPRIGLSVEVEISITCFNDENCEKFVKEALNKAKEIVQNLNGKIKME
jgi:molybdopterin-biosynthesis enzyme MoeA-like protein